MRPKFFTLRNLLVAAFGLGLAGLLFYWMFSGAPLPGSGVASTVGRIAFISERDGQSDVYMLASGSPTDTVALTNDKPTEAAPQWSSNGQRVTFTSSGRNGIVPQVYVMDAGAGSKVQALTSTSSTKSAPRFAGREQFVYYLDGGRIVSTDPSTGSTSAVLPSADQKKALSNLLAEGGISRIEVAADGSKIAAVLNLERGKALLLLDQESGTLAVVAGAAGEIVPRFLADGTLTALITEGAGIGVRTEEGVVAVPMPGLVAKEDQPELTTPTLELTQGTTDNLLVQFDESGKSKSAVRLPFAPNDLAVQSNGKAVVFCVESGKDAGLYSLSFEQNGASLKLAQTGCRQPAFSPDGSQVTFVSGDDIYLVPTDGTTAPVNLTQGKGKNSDPSFSPAVAAAKP